MSLRKWVMVSTLGSFAVGGCSTSTVAETGSEQLQGTSEEILGLPPLLGCSSDAQCSGGLVCDLGQCLLGQCIYLPLLGCTNPGSGGGSSTGGASGSGGATATGGTGSGAAPGSGGGGILDDLLSCEGDSDCNSGLLCSATKCLLGVCILNPILGCNEPPPGTGGSGSVNPPPDKECGTDSHCNDGKSCTLDVCVEVLGLCAHAGILGCSETGDTCSNDTDCATGSLLEVGLCVQGQCVLGVGVGVGGGTGGSGNGSGGAGNGGGSGGSSSGTGGSGGGISVGILCDSKFDCDDADPCTADVCVAPLGLCANIGIPLCDDDGIDIGIGIGTGGSGNGSGGSGNGGGSGGSGSGTGGTGSGTGGNGSGTGGNDNGTGSGGTSSGSGGNGNGTGTGGNGSGDDSDDEDSGSGPGTGTGDSDDGGDGADGADRGGDIGDGEGEDGMEIRGGACSFDAPRGSSSPWTWVFAAFAGLLFWRRRALSGGEATQLALSTSSVSPEGRSSSRRIGWGVLVVLLSVALPQTASAQGFSSDTNPVPVAPEDLLWTERAAIPMDHLSVFGRAMLGYADDPLIMRNTATGEDTPIIDSQYSLYMSAGVAFFERFHVAAMLPLYVQTGASAPASSFDPDGFSVGNPAIDARVTILDVRAPFELGLAGTVTLPVGGSEQLVADEAATGTPRILLGKSWGEKNRSFIALNTGVVFRQNSSLGNVQMGNELKFGAGINWAFWGPLAVTGEVSGRTNFEAAFEENATPIGVLFGLRYAPEGFSLAAGAGPGVTGGAGSPEFRALAMGGVRLNRKKEEVPAPPQPEKKERPPVAVVPPVDPCESENPPQDPAECPELDADGDSIINRLDKCPLEPEDFDGFQDEDGCPDEDNDGDGIPDAQDKCPLDAETFNGIDDEDGCPDKVRVVDGQIATLEPIFFETASSKIQERSESLLVEMARVIASRSELGVISVEGHTDARGSDAANLKLSQERANSVRSFLISAGVSGDRIVATGYGESRPLVSGDTAAAYATNRRVEFRFGGSDTAQNAVK